MAEKNSLTMSDYQKAGNEMEKLYNLLQKYSGLSDGEYWCMMAVYKGECQYQYEISEHYFMNRQTVNSALRKLERKGYINIVTPENNRRIRQIIFTNNGYDFAKKYLDVVYNVEQRVWAHLSSDEQNVLVNNMNNINQLLRIEVEQLKITE
ncbi:MAG: MarR family winged helix-turn-helix transcriptional regulator [Lachnospirales bacterium]